AVHGQAAAGRLEDAGDELEQRRLSGAVAPDDAEGLAAVDGEGDVLHRLHARLRLQLHVALEQRALQRRELRAPAPLAVGLVDVLQRDGELRHNAIMTGLRGLEVARPHPPQDRETPRPRNLVRSPRPTYPANARTPSPPAPR